jgi:hypothetical protein
VRAIYRNYFSDQTDIVAQRYDAGVRWGEQVGKDMLYTVRGFLAVVAGFSESLREERERLPG